MNCNSCIKKVDCVIYNQFKDGLSTEWSLENNFCNKYQGVLVDDSFAELLNELESLSEANEELIEEKEELEEDIDNYKSLVEDLKDTNSELEDKISELNSHINELDYRLDMLG